MSLAGDCSTVAEGVKTCLKLQPALVIVDWLLPDGKGIDVVRALAPKLASTRFLFLSSAEKAHIVREAIDAGVQGFVMKREPYDTLREAIRAVLTGRSFYCATSSRLLVEAMLIAPDSGPNGLTARERDILRGLARSESIKVIAARFGSSPKTVNNQLGALKTKLGIFDLVGLARYAVDHGLADDA